MKLKFNILSLIYGISITVASLSNAETVNDYNGTDKDPRLTRTDWKKIIKWPASCDIGVQHITDISKDFVGVDKYSLPNGQKLISVVCETGAYNQGEMIFLESQKRNNQYKALTFTQFKLLEDAQGLKFDKNTIDHKLYKTKNSLLWGNVFVDTNAMTIQNDNFYRSGGGCGVSTVYSLKDSNLSISRLNTNTNCETGDKPISQWQSFTKEQYSNWPSLLDE